MVFDVNVLDSQSPDPQLSALYLWGYNVKGQTSHLSGPSGDPRTHHCQRSPQFISPEEFRDKAGSVLCLTDVSCGLLHTAAVSSDGSLFTWGANDFGQLGDGTENDSRTPKRVESLRKEKVQSVACGAYFTAAISQSQSFKEGSEPGSGDRLWVWGQNQCSNFPSLLRSAFPPNKIIKQVACGNAHAAAITTDGLLQTWGYNEYGQLGRGFRCDGRQEAKMVSSFIRFIDESVINTEISSVACGDYHTAAISASGELYTWGLGAMGQLGHRYLQNATCECFPRRVVALEHFSIRQVACGGAHTCAITTTGALYIWGGGREGQLGMGRHAVPIPQMENAIINSNAISNSNSNLNSNSNTVTSILRLPTLLMPRGVQTVTCGQSHTLASSSHGRLLGWGYNSCGQAATGLNAYAWNPTPIDWCVGEVKCLSAGGGHSAVLTVFRSLRDICEWRIATSLTLSVLPHVIDVAARMSADSLLRYCLTYKDYMSLGIDQDMDDDEERRRRPRGNYGNGWKRNE